MKAKLQNYIVQEVDPEIAARLILDQRNIITINLRNGVPEDSVRSLVELSLKDILDPVYRNALRLFRSGSN